MSSDMMGPDMSEIFNGEYDRAEKWSKLMTDMQPGIELDAIVAEEVMGLNFTKRFHPSRDPEAAGQVLIHLEKLGIKLDIKLHDATPYDICVAALKAVSS